MSCLIEGWISRANAKQRRGRAGRLRAGTAFHMFTRHRHNCLMHSFQVPEMLRVPLQDLCLQIRLLDLGSAAQVLDEALQPPPPKAIETALAILSEVGAMDSEERLTPLGRHLAQLPVDVRIGKLLLYGAVFQCINPIATIAAAMSFKSPFVSPMDRRDEADAARRSFAGNDQSDHLALLRAYEQWEEARDSGKGAEREFCRRKFVSRATMRMLCSLREQFARNLQAIGFLPRENRGRGLEQVLYEASQYSTCVPLLQAILCAGLYPHVVRAQPSGQRSMSYTTSDGAVHLHPVSCNHSGAGRKLAPCWMAYLERVQTSRVYIRDSTVVSPYALLLFGGEIEVLYEHRELTVDKWMRFQAAPRTAVIFRQLRVAVEQLLERKIEQPAALSDASGTRLVHTLVKLIANERRA